MNCFFCEKKTAIVKIENKVGVQLVACEDHAAHAFSVGYKFIGFVSAQHHVQRTAFAAFCGGIIFGVFIMFVLGVLL